MLIEHGKFRGKIIMTGVYASPLCPNAGSECVRANVELSFQRRHGYRQLFDKYPQCSGLTSICIERFDLLPIFACGLESQNRYPSARLCLASSTGTVD